MLPNTQLSARVGNKLAVFLYSMTKHQQYQTFENMKSRLSNNCKSNVLYLETKNGIFPCVLNSQIKPNLNKQMKRIQQRKRIHYLLALGKCVHNLVELANSRESYLQQETHLHFELLARRQLSPLEKLVNSTRLATKCNKASRISTRFVRELCASTNATNDKRLKKKICTKCTN